MLFKSCSMSISTILRRWETIRTHIFHILNNVSSDWEKTKPLHINIVQSVKGAFRLGTSVLPSGLKSCVVVFSVKAVLLLTPTARTHSYRHFDWKCLKRTKWYTKRQRGHWLLVVSQVWCLVVLSRSLCHKRVGISSFSSADLTKTPFEEEIVSKTNVNSLHSMKYKFEVVWITEGPQKYRK